MSSRIRLGVSWLELLEDVFEEDFMEHLRSFLVKEKKKQKSSTRQVKRFSRPLT